MKAIQKGKLQLGDTQIPDLFILNYMSVLEVIDIRLYIYLLYNEKNSIEFDISTLSKNICASEQEVKLSLERLQTEGLILKNSNGFIIVDIKEVEINKTYIPKMEPKINRVQSELEKKRIAAAEAINESFFQGIMSLGWYTDISTLFKNYSFSGEVMIALFQYCQERKALNKKYVYAVAENWYNGGVKTFEQLEEFLEDYDEIQKIKQKIVKSLRLNRNLTKYEEQYVNTWIKEYHYNFEIIEEALKRTVAVASPSISYINGIINNWYKKGYKTVDDIKNNSLKPKTEKDKTKESTNNEKNKYQNYEQRNYDDLESFYDNF
jgi:DnaD/phage-associated family protein